MKLDKRNTAGWVTSKLDDQVDILIGGTPARKKKEYWDAEKESDNVWVSIKDLSDLNGHIIIDSSERITDSGVQHSNVKLIKKGTPLMSFKLSIGKTAIAGKDLYTNEAIAAFVPKNNDIDVGFLYHVLPTLIYDMDTAVKGKTLNKEKLKKAVVTLPPLNEQKKIAEILSSVDDDIQATQKVIDQTEQVKKGLMRDLFTKGIGHTKFKDSELGMIPEGWEVAKLGSLVKFTSGGTPRKSNQAYWQGDIPWVSPKDMKDKEVFDAQDHVSQEGLKSCGVAKNGQLLMVVRSGILIRTVPIAITRKTVGFNQDIKGLQIKDDDVSSLYLYHYLKLMEELILKKGVKRGNTVHSVVTSFLENLYVPRPSKLEQEQIVKFLESLDDKLAVCKSKEQALFRVKKGLMKDLLNGEKRV